MKRSICENVSSRPTGSFSWFCWNDSACTFFPATTTHLFFQSLSPHTLCSCLETFSTTNNICNFWRIKFQQFSNHAFCSWDEIITQKWDCCSPNNLCNCTESPPMLSTNSSIERDLHLSWSNQFITSFRLEMNVGGFSKHQNKTRDADGYKGYFSTSGVFQVNAKTLTGVFEGMKTVFEQWTELQVR